MTRACRTAILISGRGSNMAALIEAARAHDFPAEIVLVVASKAGAAGLDVARAAGIDTDVIPPRKGAAGIAAEARLDARLRQAGTEIIALAGYMHILSSSFVDRWRGRIINIHPSLLPAFPGLHTHRRALAAGVTRHGCTVHHVVAKVDAGPIICQVDVGVRDGDTEESLAARVLAAEHRLYPEALAKVARQLANVDCDKIAAVGQGSSAAS